MDRRHSFNYQDSLIFDRDGIPQDLDEAAAFLEAGIEEEVQFVEANAPPVTASIPERLAYLLASARIAAESAVLADFKEQIGKTDIDI